MINVILSAGASQRFFDAGYIIPKFLLKIKKQYMFLQAAKSLPKKNDWIFIFQTKHLEKYSSIKKSITKEFKKFSLISLKKKTSGQASTLLKIKKKINHNEDVFVTSNDMYFKYDKKKFNKLVKSKNNVVFVTKPSKYMLANPKYFGWVRHSNNIAKLFSIKKKFKSVKKNDSVIIGSFYFNKFEDFVQNFNFLKKRKGRVNKEYYIDSVIEQISFNKKVAVLPVSSLINWGTPTEYEKSNGLKS
ncbi:hypothetical protein [Candidatus Pelagibacter communis]|uniref:hypothetical protein n=1 Tax=Pelagibacter ubique TaxID=198252 RepID=UPI00094CE819|nr:hypothetical protein [Candidatus Pelagibacter ubique]